LEQLKSDRVPEPATQVVWGKTFAGLNDQLYAVGNVVGSSNPFFQKDRNSWRVSQRFGTDIPVAKFDDFWTAGKT